MIALKGIGVKVGLGLLTLVFGVAGVATGAKWHANHSQASQHRVVAGRITQLYGSTVAVFTIGGKRFVCSINTSTVVRYAGHRVAITSLRQGDLVTITATLTVTGYSAQTIHILKQSSISTRAP